MFMMEAKIRVKAGDGGNGLHGVPGGRSLLRRVGPPAATAARVADIVMESSSDNTLVPSASSRTHGAARTGTAKGRNKTEADGIVLEGPVGSVLFSDGREPGEKIFEIHFIGVESFVRDDGAPERRGRGECAVLRRVGASGTTRSPPRTRPGAIGRGAILTGWN